MPVSRVICATCRHPRPLHRNGTDACHAQGCHSGPGGIPCTGFAASAAPVRGSTFPQAVFQSPQYLRAAG